MKNLYRLCLIFASLCIAIGIYITTGKDAPAALEKPAAPSKNTNLLVTPGNGSKVESQNFPATDINKPTAKLQQKSTSSPTTAPPQITAEPASHLHYAPPLLQKYSAKMPTIYRRIPENTPGVDYSGRTDFSAETLAYFKKLSDQGDIQGKFLYADRLWGSINKDFQKEYLLKGDMIDLQPWKIRFAEVEKLYIEAAVAGFPWAASQLPVPIPQIQSDNIDELSWALITDQMDNQGNKTLAFRCEQLGEECTDDLLEKALDRAELYLDIYNFNKTGKTINSKKTDALLIEN